MSFSPIASNTPSHSNAIAPCKRKADALWEAESKSESGSETGLQAPDARFPAIEPAGHGEDSFSGDGPVVPQPRPDGRRCRGNLAKGRFPRQSWPFLLALFDPEASRTYPDFQRLTGTSRVAAGSFMKQLRKLGAAMPRTHGLPQVDRNHPAVRAALLEVHSLLLPLAARSPLPPRPQRPEHGSQSLLHFLGTQPPGEWFSAHELERHIDVGGRPTWMTTTLRSCVEQDMLQERDPHEKPRHYRMDPAYRAAIAGAARHLPWKTLFPDLEEPPRFPGAPLAPAAWLSLDSFPGHLRSRGLDDRRPASPAAALDFLASRGIAGQLLECGSHAPGATYVLRLLNSREEGCAFVCLPGDPRYLEAWRDAGDTWRARPLSHPPAPRDTSSPQLSDVLAGYFGAHDGKPAPPQPRIVLFGGDAPRRAGGAP